MTTHRKGFFNFNGRLQSITDILKERGVSEFLQRNGPMKEGPQRNKLRRLLKVNGITREAVDAYLQEEIRNNRDPFIILPRQRGSIVINGEQMTARQALNRFPLLSGYLQQKRPLNEKALHAKVIRDFRTGKILDHITYEEPPQFNLYGNHFGGARIRYKLDDPRIKYRNLESLFDLIRPQVLELIRANRDTKVGLSVSPWMIRRSGNDFIRQLKGLHSGTRFENFQGTNPEALFDAMCEIIREQFHRVESMEGSGWMLESIDHVILAFSEIPAIVGSSYKPLPMELELRRENGIDNIDNSRDDTDCYCSKYSVARAEFLPTKKPEQKRNVVTKRLREQTEKFDWTGISFPTPLHEWNIFENLNRRSVQILGWDDDEKQVTCLRHPSTRYEKIIRLFYYDGHYSTVRNMSALMRAGKNSNASHYCPYCTYHHRTADAVKRHKKDCKAEKRTIEIMPKEGSVVKFVNLRDVAFKPFVIYADFECRLERVNIKKGDKTTQTQIHKSSGYCLRFVSRVDLSESRTIQYTAKTDDENVALHFIRTVTDLVYEIGTKYSEERPMKITEEEQETFDNATRCWICNNQFVDDDKVRDHCHYTGKYRGAAHGKCNLALKKDKTIPVGFHNGTKYDFHLLVRELGCVNGYIRTIARNSEQYISVEKAVRIGETTVVDNNGDPKLDKTGKPLTKRDTWYIRLVDTLGFLQASLANCVKTFPRDEFKMLNQEFGDEHFDLLIRKGVFPYDWFVSVKNLDEDPKNLTRDDFYSALNDEHISDDDYAHFLNVCNKFNLQTMRDYHDFYCKVDTIQLADIMEYQRERLMQTHGLDILHSYTLPGFSWKAALKYTGQVLELISDREMYDFVQEGKRGGISTIPHRYAKANNPYMGLIRDKLPIEIMVELKRRANEEQQFSVEMVCDYFQNFSSDEIADLKAKMANGVVFNPDQIIKYLIYLDANNLYGWAMSQPLPTGGFNWMSDEELKLPIEDFPPCFVKVDLEYPEDLHDYFAEFVPAPDNIIPEGSKVKKLAPSLLPKKDYVCHIRNLQLYKKLGVKITRVHKALKFDESAWLKPYIDLNTKLRAAATNDADKDMYKLLNNAVFGKTCENLLGRTEYQLASSRKEALKYISKPTFKDYTVYNETLAGIHLDPSKVTLNKPSYVGIAVLELSKILMYDFFYYNVKARYDDRAQLLMTDTDSLLLEIQTDDWYNDIRDEVKTLYDTSAYPVNHPAELPRVNKKVIGLWKDEYKGRTVSEYAGTCSKSYALTLSDYPGMCKKDFCDGGCEEKSCIGNGGKSVKVQKSPL